MGAMTAEAGDRSRTIATGPHILRSTELAPLTYEAPIEHIGEIPVTYGAEGEYLSTRKLKKPYDDLAAQGIITPEQEIQRYLIANAGFNGRWVFPGNYRVESDEEQERAARRTARTAIRLLNDRDWGGADIMYIGSITVSNDMPQRVVEIMAKEGFSVGEARFYALACASTGVATVNFAREHQGEDVSALIIGQNSLSGDRVDPNNPQITATFGNGVGGLALNGREIRHHGGHTKVIRDEKGAICVPSLYHLPDVFDRTPPPDWVEVDPNAENVFAYDTSGNMMMIMPIPAEGAQYATVDPIESVRCFSKSSAEPLMMTLIEWYEAHTDSLLGTGLAHQATKQTLEGILRYAWKNYIRVDQKIGMSKVDHIPQLRGMSKEKFNTMFPFMMNKRGVRMSNFSDGTWIVPLAEMGKRGMIKPGVPFPNFVYGVGLTISADILEFLQQNSRS